MIQRARSINSTSLLREAQQAVLVLGNEEEVEYFQALINEVVANRKDPDVRYTGAKDARRELLALLNQYGEVQTANIWCRGLIVDLAHINQLRRLIASALAEKNIYGVVEIHLQDREINSPHIQFVGIKAEVAEDIIAHIVADLKYELSAEMAKGDKKVFVPHFDENPHAHTSNLDYLLEKEQKRRLLIEDIEIKSKSVADFVRDMRVKREEFLKILDDKVDEARKDIQRIELPRVHSDKKIYEKTTQEAISDLGSGMVCYCFFIHHNI